MNSIIRNAKIVTNGKTHEADILIEDGFIAKIGQGIAVSSKVNEYDAKGQYVIPGAIDDQVHFREPGLTHKADIGTESRAALAGGITSFMEMPNVNPQTTTNAILEDKINIGKLNSAVNYSFYLGVTNHNIEEVKKVNPKTVCGVKAFLGSSTGDMLVDQPQALEELFKECPILLATHCEDEARIRKQTAEAIAKYGDDIPAHIHPVIRDEEACYLSSSMAVDLANRYGTRLHILHITTAKELELFRNDIPLADKKITAEACVHHLYFSADDYAEKGNLIKCNPAIKEAHNREAIWEALLDNRIDVVATDHAPHTWEEKQQAYLQAPSGLPLNQHSLLVLLDFYAKGIFSLEQIVQKTSHNIAERFQIKDRGYIQEGCFADLAIIDLRNETHVTKENILYHCNWSPFQNYTFPGMISHTILNGEIVYQDGRLKDHLPTGSRIEFNR